MSHEIFSDSQYDKIKQIYDSLKINDEFEFMFNNYSRTNKMNISNFKSILNYITLRSKQDSLKLVNNVSLDTNYNYDLTNKNVYRIEIEGINKINDVMKTISKRKNHVIFSILVSRKISDDDKSIAIINKVKDSDNTFNIDEQDIRVRLSKETTPTKETLNSLLSIDEKERFNISFRYKQRVSIFIVDNDEVSIRIDLTYVKTSNNINTLESGDIFYELELEIMKKKEKIKTDYLQILIDEVTKLKIVLQQSDNIITNNEKEEVLSKYKELIFGNKETKINELYFMNAYSLEIQHVTDFIPLKYSVTDKADGDRAEIIITNNKVFLIAKNLDVKYTGITLDTKLQEYNNTILDGEYLYSQKYKKNIFLSFDILFYKGEDYRNVSLLEQRLKKLDDVLEKCFNYKYKYTEYTKNFNLDDISEHHKKEIIKFMNELNTNLEKNPNNEIITRKYFIFTVGGNESEIFAYSNVIYTLYTKDENVKCPYNIDGFMYTPLDQKYTKVNKNIKYNIYKWKPPNKNSIDFYIDFEKDRETGQIINVFDNSDTIGADTEEDTFEPEPELPTNKIYRICNLNVGKSEGKQSQEYPVRFQKETENYIAHLFLEDGAIRDISGDIIQDKTVCEFYYNSDSKISPKRRWVPIRTRYDKTEMVNRYGKKYGNNEEVANKVWRSIINPITFENDILKLANPLTYQEHMKSLKDRIDTSIITNERQQNQYYQRMSNLAKPMRNFHNWIKSNIIYTYCSKKNILRNNKFDKYAFDILDVGVGQGGDIMKFFHSRVKSLVGFDPDPTGLYDATNGALSRYKNFKSKFPSFPPMNFMVADATALLNYTDQTKIIGPMSSSNSDLLIKYFGNSIDEPSGIKFDVFNCEFMIHYLFKDEIVWNNFCQNINTYLKPNGYILITAFDGDIVYNKLKETGKINSYYTTDDGEKILFFEVVKKYDNTITNIDNVGIPIDVHVTIFSEDNVYITEYLVGKKFLESELKKKCNMRLVETNLFENVYNNDKLFFEKYADLETLPTKKFLMDVKKFYDMNDSVNKASFEMSMLNRYYIFQKMDDNEKEYTEKKSEYVSKKSEYIPKKSRKNSRNQQKGGNNDFVMDI